MKARFLAIRMKLRWRMIWVTLNCTRKSKCRSIPITRAKSGSKLAKKRGDLVETTVGRVLFNEILPPELRFVNDALDKKKLKELVAAVYATLGPEGTAEIVDQVKEIGFKYATRSGLTIAIDDITVPPEKRVILDRNLRPRQRSRSTISQGSHHRRRTIRQDRRVVDGSH